MERRESQGKIMVTTETTVEYQMERVVSGRSVSIVSTEIGDGRGMGSKENLNDISVLKT